MESAEQVGQRIATVSQEFNGWLQLGHPQKCRLVQYLGPEHHAMDVPLSEALSQVEGLLGEGLFVAWAIQDGMAFIKVWEYGFDEPSWDYVFREADLPNPDQERGSR